MQKFKTIKENVTVEIEEKHSKFIANIFYVENVAAAEETIKQVKKQYYDARHNCFAYIVKEEGLIKRFPILDVIEQKNLDNTLIVVTRYFGGILLGAGGLVRAYTEAATNVVEKAGAVFQEKGYEIEICVSYQDIEKLKYYCNKNNIKIINTQYEEKVKCIIEVTEQEKDEILANNEYKDKLPNIIKL